MGVLSNRVNPDAWEAEKDGIWKFDGVFFHMMPRYVDDILGNILSIIAADEVSVSYETLLMNMNDDGKTFAEIADFIEEHVLPIALKKYLE